MLFLALGSSVWSFLNSPFGLLVVATILGMIGGRVLSWRPAWRRWFDRYRPAFFEAVYLAERLIPDDTPDLALRRLDEALRFLLKLEPSLREAKEDELRRGLNLARHILKGDDLKPGGTQEPPATPPPAPPAGGAAAALLLCLALALSGCAALAPEDAELLRKWSDAGQNALRQWDALTPAQQRRAMFNGTAAAAVLDNHANGTPLPVMFADVAGVASAAPVASEGR